MEPMVVTLLMGIVLGYLAQRSRICFIGGLRDFVLVRDTELLKGAVAFFVTAWVSFSIAGRLGLVDWRAPTLEGAAPDRQLALSGAAANLPQIGDVLALGFPVLAVAVASGIALGLFSTLANGCPTRQHVLASQGVRDSAFYLGGFYLGVVIYNLVTKPLLALVF